MLVRCSVDTLSLLTQVVYLQRTKPIRLLKQRACFLTPGNVALPETLKVSNPVPFAGAIHYAHPASAEFLSMR